MKHEEPREICFIKVVISKASSSEFIDADPIQYFIMRQIWVQIRIRSTVDFSQQIQVGAYMAFRFFPLPK
jgi:hypothetical protein